MATPAVEHAQAEQPICWCCGKTFVEEFELTPLGEHPEVRVCAMCAHWLHRRAGPRLMLGGGPQLPRCAVGSARPEGVSCGPASTTGP